MPTAARHGRADARPDYDDAVRFRLERSKLTGGRIVALGDYTIAAVMPSTLEAQRRLREARLDLLVLQANELERVLEGLEKLVDAVRQRNAFDATWGKPQAIPREVYQRAAGVAIGARRFLMLEKVKANVPVR